MTTSLPPLLELPYLPPVSWMTLVWPHPVIRLEACEHFQKGSYRNRCHIAGPNGLQRLSIPLVKGKHQQTPIREVRIAYEEPWQQVHWRSIRAGYGNAPFFEYYADELAPFFEKRYLFLFDLNLELLHFLLKKMGWRGEIRFTDSYVQPAHDPLHEKTGAIDPADFRQLVSPKAPTPPDQFRPAPYPQVFSERHGFLADLSALDLLLCQGKQAVEIFELSH